jgi:hypothetical protein
MMYSLEEGHVHFGKSNMQAHIKLGRIFGIQAGLRLQLVDYCPAGRAALLNGHFGATNPRWSMGVSRRVSSHAVMSFACSRRAPRCKCKFQIAD